MYNRIKTFSIQE